MLISDDYFDTQMIVMYDMIVKKRFEVMVIHSGWKILGYKLRKPDEKREIDVKVPRRELFSSQAASAGQLMPFGLGIVHKTNPLTWGKVS